MPQALYREERGHPPQRVESGSAPRPRGGEASAQDANGNLRRNSNPFLRITGRNRLAPQSGSSEGTAGDAVRSRVAGLRGSFGASRRAVMTQATRRGSTVGPVRGVRWAVIAFGPFALRELGTSGCNANRVGSVNAAESGPEQICRPGSAVLAAGVSRSETLRTGQRYGSNPRVPSRMAEGVGDHQSSGRAHLIVQPRPVARVSAGLTACRETARRGAAGTRRGRPHPAPAARACGTRGRSAPRSEEAQTADTTRRAPPTPTRTPLRPRR